MVYHKKVCKKIREIEFDVLINNAGGGKALRLEELTFDMVFKEITLNFIAPLFLIQAVYPKMINKNYARIINISSISAKQGTPYLYVYSASKAALDSLTQSISSTNISKGFTINSICPGGINTEMSIQGRKILAKLNNMNHSSDYQNKMIESMKLESLINPNSVTNIVDFLLRKESNCINGQCLNICGALEVR